MTLNDVFDRERDRESAPARPIPSGAVSARAAALQGGLLLAGGVALAALSGARSAAIACALALAALAYDAALKRWALPGALAMGACRYLDVQLGAGFAAGPWLAPAVAVGGYTVLVTLISTCEEDPAAPARRRLLAGLVVAAVAYVIAVGYTYPHRWLGLPFFGLLAGLVAALGRGAVREPDPARVRALVLALLLGLFLLQGGALAGLGRPGLGVATAALAGSFVVIGRLVAGAAPATAAAAPSPRRGDTSP